MGAVAPLPPDDKLRLMARLNPHRFFQFWTAKILNMHQNRSCPVTGKCSSRAVAGVLSFLTGNQNKISTATP
jgi:hypothetical protein